MKNRCKIIERSRCFSPDIHTYQRHATRVQRLGSYDWDTVTRLQPCSGPAWTQLAEKVFKDESTQPVRINPTLT